jgi:hypothetical protein
MRMRRWRYGVAAAAVVGLLAAAYTPARRFQRFFLTPCAADGPAPETELDLPIAPVDMELFYAELRSAAGDATLEELAHAAYGPKAWPIYLIGPRTEAADAATLVVAGVHGNEVSGSLAAPPLLERLRERAAGASPVFVLAPANPVGLAHGSRYNGQGCDPNRDFAEFRTVEAAAIRDAIARVRPRLVVALHEGPQAGVFVIGTQLAPPALLDASVASLAQRLPLATVNNLGLPLATPGRMSEGAFLTAAKGWLGLHSLGAHTTALRIPLLTSEVPWSWPDLAQRIEAQVEVALAASLHPH